jgi:hypothetical protein
MKTLLNVLAVFLLLALTGGMVYAGAVWGARYESKFYGTVEKMPEGIDGVWVVNGKEVLVTKDTIIKEKHGKAAVGAYVEVEGNLSGKAFTAYEIEVKRALSEQPVGSEIRMQPSGNENRMQTDGSELRISGKVERIPEGLLGTWIVSGKEVFVSKDTVINEESGMAGVGAIAEVTGILSGKTFHAYRIDIRKDKK